MLDFYLIKDKNQKPDYPEQDNLEFILGLDFGIFGRLIEKGLIDSRFDYYSDFRWNNKLIEQIDVKVSKCKKSDSDVDQLSMILKKALKSKCGIIAYCD